MVNATLRFPISAVLLLTVGCGGSRAPIESEPDPAALPVYRGAAEALPSGGEAGATSSTYRIASGDLLDVVVFDAPEISRAVRVTDQGEISLPLVGIAPAAGLTPRELETSLADRLRGRYMIDPQVTVAVTEVRSDPIYVTGEVNRPGAFPLEGGRTVTVLQAVTLGEGLAPMAAKNRALIIRSGPNGARERIRVNLGAMLAGTSPDIPLRPNDIVFVPRNNAKSVASGFFGALLRVVTFRGVF